MDSSGRRPFASFRRCAGTHRTGRRTLIYGRRRCRAADSGLPDFRGSKDFGSSALGRARIRFEQIAPASFGSHPRQVWVLRAIPAESLPGDGTGMSNSCAGSVVVRRRAISSLPSNVVTDSSGGAGFDRRISECQRSGSTTGRCSRPLRFDLFGWLMISPITTRKGSLLFGVLRCPTAESGAAKHPGCLAIGAGLTGAGSTTAKFDDHAPSRTPVGFTGDRCRKPYPDCAKAR